jgi:DNA-binding MarR family transcriptional regulator
LPATDDDFSEIEQGAWGGLLGLHARMMRLIEADLDATARLTHPEFEVLLRLSWADGHRARLQDLGARAILTRSGISRVVERLERAGLVTREEAKEDRRGAYAVLTRKGLGEFRKALKAHVLLVRRHFLDLYSDAELAQMAVFWRRQRDAEATQG